MKGLSKCIRKSKPFNVFPVFYWMGVNKYVQYTMVTFHETFQKQGFFWFLEIFFIQGHGALNFEKQFVIHHNLTFDREMTSFVFSHLGCYSNQNHLPVCGNVFHCCKCFKVASKSHIWERNLKFLAVVLAKQTTAANCPVM